MDFTFISDAEAAANAMFEQLLDMPFDQGEKTARTIILEERKNLNNPAIEIKYKIPLRMDEQTKKDLAIKNYQKARELLNNQQSKEAIELFESVFDDFACNPEFFNNLGIAYYKLLT